MYVYRVSREERTKLQEYIEHEKIIKRNTQIFQLKERPNKQTQKKILIFITMTFRSRWWSFSNYKIPKNYKTVKLIIIVENKNYNITKKL